MEVLYVCFPSVRPNEFFVVGQRKTTNSHRTYVVVSENEPVLVPGRLDERGCRVFSHTYVIDQCRIDEQRRAMRDLTNQYRWDARIGFRVQGAKQGFRVIFTNQSELKGIWPLNTHTILI